MATFSRRMKKKFRRKKKKHASSRYVPTTTKDVRREFLRQRSKKFAFIGVCLALALIIIGYSITIGNFKIGFWESYEVIWNHITGDIKDSIRDHVVINLRLPRLMEGVIAGAGLAAAGAVMQSTMKNPLADPYTTGISSGASFGAALAIIGSYSLFPGQYAIVGNAFIFSLVPVMVIIVVSSMKTATPTTMILSGLSVMYIFNAVTALFMLWSNPEDTAAVYNWQIGTISSASWNNIPVMATVTVIGLIILQILSSRINLLSSGDENARSLGVNAELLRLICLIVLSLMTASIVSFTGIIGFIGLVCPHIVRMFIGSDNRYLIPASAAFGITFLLFTDLIGRTIVAPNSIPVGVITAFIGGPMFLYLILRQRRETF